MAQKHIGKPSTFLAARSRGGRRSAPATAHPPGVRLVYRDPYFVIADLGAR